METHSLLRYPWSVKYLRTEEGLVLSQLKSLVAEMFRQDILSPDDMEDDTALNGEIFDLDSFDRLELAICLEEAFGVSVRLEGQQPVVFASLNRLAAFIHQQVLAERRASPRLPIVRPLTWSIDTSSPLNPIVGRAY